MASVVQAGFQVICLRARHREEDREREGEEEEGPATLLRVWCHVSVLVKRTTPVFWLMHGPQDEELPPRFVLKPMVRDGTPCVRSAFKLAFLDLDDAFIWAVEFFRFDPSELTLPSIAPTELEVVKDHRFDITDFWNAPRQRKSRRKEGWGPKGGGALIDRAPDDDDAE
eukprot:3203687-Pyramimonas_sp.AAC.1